MNCGKFAGGNILNDSILRKINSLVNVILILKLNCSVHVNIVSDDVMRVDAGQCKV